MLDLQNELVESKRGTRTKQGTLSVHGTSSVCDTCE
jgi:hypothetical protein